MIYYLKNKDDIVLNFVVKNTSKKLSITQEEIFTSEILDVEVYNEAILPRSLKNLEKVAPFTNLYNWVIARKAPNHRKYISNILKDTESLTNYIDISFGLSLNDTFWIVPETMANKFKWNDVSLYKNNFDERLALAAFGFTYFQWDKDEYSLSPEFTTDGGLIKCWNKNKKSGVIELFKGIEPNANQGKENYTEFYVSQIAQTLGLNAIKYDLKEFNGVLVSSCELFTNEKEGYISIGKCIPKIQNGEARKEYLDKIMPIYGKDNLCDLFVFDGLIYNTDRHLGNFGMMIDNDTQELSRPAPIFDNGNSLFNIITNDDYNGKIQELLKPEKSWFGYTFDEQLRLFTQPRHAQMYAKLLNFTFRRHERFNLPENELVKVENLIQQRSKMIVDLALNLQNKINQSQGNNYYNPYEEPSSGGIKP